MYQSNIISFIFRFVASFFCSLFFQLLLCHCSFVICRVPNLPMEILSCISLVLFSLMQWISIDQGTSHTTIFFQLSLYTKHKFNIQISILLLVKIWTRQSRSLWSTLSNIHFKIGYGFLARIFGCILSWSWNGTTFQLLTHTIFSHKFPHFRE